MKKRIMNLKNSDGHALVLGVILLLFFIMLYYVIFAYAEYRSTAIFVQTTAESTLDEYTAEQGRIKAASIKNGTYSVLMKVQRNFTT